MGFRQIWLKLAHKSERKLMKREERRDFSPLPDGMPVPKPTPDLPYCFPAFINIDTLKS